MKAIYIPSIFDPATELDKLNEQLKGCQSIIWSTSVNDMSLPGGINSYGTLIIVAEEHIKVKDKVKKDFKDKFNAPL